MNSVIPADAQAAPELFVWNGPIERSRIEAWVARQDGVIPDDLVQFWTITGGGELVETERVLPPFAAANDEDEISGLTGWCRERGMPSGHIVFHEGFSYTAIRCRDGAYVSLDGEVRDQVVALTRRHDLLIVTEDRHVLRPSVKEVLAAIHRSPSFAYASNPLTFLNRLADKE